MLYNSPLESQNTPLQEWVYKLTPLQKNTYPLGMVFVFLQRIYSQACM